ncbi:MAG: hypothetical protein NVS3B16_26460 [Vulcanimicrobiaceae bacterium]
MLAFASPFASLSRPATAATPLSVELGEQFSTQRPLSVSEPYLGLDYDLGPKTTVPIRASVRAVIAGGGRGIGGSGFGIAARTTAPLYLGTTHFVGSSLFALPGGSNVAVRGTYRIVPSRSSSVGVGLRVQL